MKDNRYLQLEGANCPSCAYTIERVGRKLDGVDDVHVETDLEKVKVDFSTDDRALQDATLAQLVKVVQRIGYNATIEK